MTDAIPPHPSPPSLREGLGPLGPESRLRDAAERLEAGFLKEMLGAAGLGRAPGAFGGGQGEEQFGSFLLEAQAAAVTRAGGIGLAESLFEALKDRHAR